jgi:hypothetical protein
VDGIQQLLAGVIREVILDATAADPATRASALDWLSTTEYFTAIGGEGLRATILKKVAKPQSAKRLAELIGAKPVKAPPQRAHQPVTRPPRKPCSQCGRLSIAPVCAVC